jgi:SAM-dependent methyltransferase
MSTSNQFVLDANRKQAVSETDTFTVERYRQMFRHLPLGVKKVMDVGCNTGRGGAVLKEMNSGLELVGLDCVPERIQALDRKVYGEAICAFTTELPLEDNSLDAIVAGEFLEHVPPSQIEGTLTEFFRVLRLRGRLVLTTPNPGYLKNRLKNLSVLLEKSHLTQHYPKCLGFRLRSIGFSRVRIRGSGRMIRYVGQHFPLLNVYGSYLLRADKW